MQHLLGLALAALLLSAPGTKARPPITPPAHGTIARPPARAPRGAQEQESCTPGYDPCIPPGPDVDCAGGSGDGPRYVEGPIRVTGSDPYRLDSDRNGIGCE